jgi:hypothetical protein
MKAYVGSRDIVPLILTFHRMEVCGQLHVLTALPQYPLSRSLGGP